MKSLMVLLTAAFFLSDARQEARAQAVIEGAVQLPKPTGGTAATLRYQGAPADPLRGNDPLPAVVYLEGQFPAGAATNKPATVQMAQKNLQFAPPVLAIQKGTLVEFPNLDDLYHNVFSYSKTKRFNLGRYLKDEKPATQTFDQPGVIKLYCEIHEHMRGTILVLDTPYFVTTRTNGAYRLENLPAGKFVLKTWVNEKTTWERPVELEAGKTLRVDFPGK